MCRDDQSSRWWLLALLGLVLLFAARTVSGQELLTSDTPTPSPQSNETLPNTDPTPTDQWASFDQLWTSLKDELTQSDADSQALLTSLEALRIEADELRSSLTESTRLYEQSEASRMIEREAAEARITDAILRGIDAEKSRDRWKITAIILGGVGIILAGSLALSIVL